MDLEDGVRAQLGREPPDLAAPDSLDVRRDGVPEEAEHHMFGQGEGLDRQVRLEHGVARRVKVEDRGVVGIGHVVLECGNRDTADGGSGSRLAQVRRCWMGRLFA